MECQLPPQQTVKLVRHYSERRELDIVLRIRFQREEAGGCRVFHLLDVQELDG